MSKRATAQPVDVRIIHIAATYRTHTIKEQAALFGLSHSRIGDLRSEALRRGLVTPDQRRTDRRWTARDDERLQRLIAANTTMKRIAHVLGRSLHSVKTRCKVLGVSVRDLRTPHYAITPLSHVFGVYETLIRQWIKLGWLQAERRGNSWYITRAAVETFVQIPEAWPTYSTAVISDPALQQLAQAARRGARGRWVTPRELAQVWHRSEDVVYRQIRNATLPYRAFCTGRRWYIWIPNEEAQP